MTKSSGLLNQFIEVILLEATTESKQKQAHALVDRINTFDKWKKIDLVLRLAFLDTMEGLEGKTKGSAEDIQREKEAAERQILELKELVKNLPAVTRSAVAKKGASVRDAKRQPLKEYALALAKDGKYKSRNHAAQEIADKVSKYAVRMGLRPLKRTLSGHKTLCKWFKEGGYDPNAKKSVTSAS